LGRRSIATVNLTSEPAATRKPGRHNPPPTGKVRQRWTIIHAVRWTQTPIADVIVGSLTFRRKASKVLEPGHA
jgi:hypothetical protein